MKPLNCFILACLFQMGTHMSIYELIPNFAVSCGSNSRADFINSRPCLLVFALCQAVQAHTQCSLKPSPISADSVVCIFYLDGTIIIAWSQAPALKHQDFDLSLLQDLGLIINLKIRSGTLSAVLLLMGRTGTALFLRFLSQKRFPLH